MEYKPSPILLDCLIKYEKKKTKIEDLYLNSVWLNKNLAEKDYKNLHSFFWLFSLDLKSSKKITQTVILNWIEENNNYNKKIGKLIFYLKELLLGFLILGCLLEIAMKNIKINSI